MIDPIGYLSNNKNNNLLFSQFPWYLFSLVLKSVSNNEHFSDFIFEAIRKAEQFYSIF